MLPSNTARQIMQDRPLVMLVLGSSELAPRSRHFPLILSIVPSVRNSGFWNARVLFPRRRPRLSSPRTIAPTFAGERREIRRRNPRSKIRSNYASMLSTVSRPKAKDKRYLQSTRLIFRLLVTRFRYPRPKTNTLDLIYMKFPFIQLLIPSGW